jgi:meso-butanediol dehydrogenase/(S,S)-butanediol dehydrogenase/diacetyl reductase
MARALAGMTVAITGASAGIGAALALALAGSGARLALCARRPDKLAEVMTAVVAATPGADAGRHWSCRADVADPADCAAFIAGAEGHFAGPVDTLVCNAGYGLWSSIANTTPADWERIMRTNLLGTTECIRAALPRMRQAPLRAGWRAQVMIVSSGLARRGKPEGGAYSATKAAQLSVAEALRIEESAARIAVTSVHPVTTTTDFIAASATVGEQPWSRYRNQPEQTAEQVAAAMVAAMVKPRAEVWPHAASRWALSFGTIWPEFVDRYLLKQRS